MGWENFSHYLGFIVFGVIIVFVIIKNSNKNKASNLANGNENRSNVNLIKLRYAMHIEGLDYLGEGQECDLIVDEEKLTIIAGKSRNFNIMLDQIVNANILTKKEVEMKNKSVIGRGIIGGVLTGGVGLLLGGLSGVGQKVKEKSKHFLVINYKSKDNGEIKVLTFGLYIDDQRFVKKLTKRLNTDISVNL